jgi:type II secretory pathway pseudopilin PulG
MRYLHSTSPKGFTLIEIIVSMAIFMVVAVVAIGAFLKVIDANKKSHTIKTAMTNLNFIMETMTREIRVGTNYYCASGSSVPTTLPDYGLYPGCSTLTGPWVMAFESSHAYPPDNPTCHLIYAYYFNNSDPTHFDSLTKAEQQVCDGPLSPYPLISSDIKQDVFINITKATVKVVTGGAAQPYAQFRFQGYAGATEKVKTTFDLQTTVSQRLKP